MPKRIYQTLLIFLILSLLGLLAIPRIGIRLNPAPAGSQLSVSLVWAGAAPLVMEQRVTTPVEGVLSTLRGVEKVESMSSYHYATVTLTLHSGADTDRIRFEVAAQLRQLYPRLPPGVTYPQVTLRDPEASQRQQPFMTLQANGDAAISDLTEFAERVVKPRLARVPGLDAVRVWGSPPEQWRVTYRPELLASLHLTKADLVTALRQSGLREQVGWVRSDGRQVSLSLSAPEGSAGGEVNLPDVPILAATGAGPNPHGDGAGRVVHLRDVATVTRAEVRATGHYRVNGRNAVQLVLTARPETNQLTASRAVREALAAMQRQFPPGYGIRVDYDASDFIGENLRLIGGQSGAAIGILLLVVALTVRRGRYVLLILSSLLVNLLLSALLFYVLGVTMHLYSLAALTVSLGLLVDNAIVMIDHYRHYRHRRVLSALLGATLTTCAALTVIWFLPEQARHDLLEFGQVLIITLGVSLAVAYWFVPAWLEMWPLQDSAEARRPGRWVGTLDRFYGRFLGYLTRFRGLVIGAGVLAFGLPLFLLPTSLEKDKPLAGLYNATLGHEYYLENVRPALDKWLGGTLRLFVNYVYEGAYYADNERTMLRVEADLPNQSTIEQMNDLMQQMESEVARQPEVERFTAEVYSGQRGSMSIFFKKEFETGAAPYRLKGRLVNRSTATSGVGWDIYGVGQGFNQHLGQNNTPSFNVLLRGYNYDQLERLATRLGDRLLAHPRIQTVDINHVPGYYSQKDLYAYSLAPDAAALVRRGGNAAALMRSVAERFDTRPQADFYRLGTRGNEGVQVVPTAPGDLWQLRNVALPIGGSPPGGSSPSNDLPTDKLTDARLEREAISPQIRKENQQYLRQVSFEYFGNYGFGSEFLDEQLKEFKAELPLGYTVERTSNDWWRRDAQRQYGLLGLVALVIFIIGAVLFESLRQPFWMISQIPLSFVGLFLAFYLTGFNFDQGGYAAFLLLAGLVVNAVIFILNEYNAQLRLQPAAPASFRRMAYRRALRHKIRPILLSTLTTVTGLLPFLWIGGEQPFWPALAIGTIGGLAMSLVMLLVVLPVLVLRR